MENEIIIGLDWREVPGQALQRKLVQRFHGRRLWGFSAIVVVTTALVVWMVLSTYDQSANLIPLAFVIGVCAFALLSNALTRRLYKALMEAPIRATPTKVTLGPQGISSPGARVAGTIPWSFVTEVEEVEGGVIALFSPVEFIPLMDSQLPAGMDRAVLLRQIKEWRDR